MFDVRTAQPLDLLVIDDAGPARTPWLEIAIDPCSHAVVEWRRLLEDAPAPSYRLQ